jgi:hypothetical protein
MSDGTAISRPSLIAGESSTTWYEGAGVLEAAMAAKDGFVSGNYGSFAGNTAVMGLSALSAVMDPFQVIFAAGVGWLMEHVAILREPLDWLAGDPKEIEGHAATWRNLQKRTYDATEYLADRVNTTTAGWGSLAADAYRHKAGTMAHGALALGEVADAMAEATVLAGSIVGLVRNTVRDLIAEVVGAAVSKALQALLVVTIPKIVADVAIMIAKYAAKISKVLKRLTAAIHELGEKLPALARVCDKIKAIMDEAIAEAAHGATIGNAYRVEAAETRLANDDSALKAFRTASNTLGDGNVAVHGTSLRVAVDATREGLKVNSLQNGGAATDTLTGAEPTPPTIDLPL